MESGDAQALIEITVLSTMLLETLERLNRYEGSHELMADLRELSEWARAELGMRNGCTSGD